MTPLFFPLPEDERCLSSLTAAKDRGKLSNSMSHFLLVWFLQLSVRASSKCHYVQVSTPAVRDHLTFYCDLGLFRWHLPLPQFACWMFHCCGKCQYVCTGEVPVFSSSSSFLFSVFSPSLSFQTRLFPCCWRHGTAAVNADSEHVKHTRRQRGNVSHCLEEGSPHFCHVPCGCRWL